MKDTCSLHKMYMHVRMKTLMPSYNTNSTWEDNTKQKIKVHCAEKSIINSKADPYEWSDDVLC